MTQSNGNGTLVKDPKTDIRDDMERFIEDTVDSNDSKGKQQNVASSSSTGITEVFPVTVNTTGGTNGFYILGTGFNTDQFIPLFNPISKSDLILDKMTQNKLFYSVTLIDEKPQPYTSPTYTSISDFTANVYLNISILYGFTGDLLTNPSPKFIEYIAIKNIGTLTYTDLLASPGVGSGTFTFEIFVDNFDFLDNIEYRQEVGGNLDFSGTNEFNTPDKITNQQITDWYNGDIPTLIASVCVDTSSLSTDNKGYMDEMQTGGFLKFPFTGRLRENGIQTIYTPSKTV